MASRTTQHYNNLAPEGSRERRRSRLAGFMVSCQWYFTKRPLNETKTAIVKKRGTHGLTDSTSKLLTAPVFLSFSSVCGTTKLPAAFGNTVVWWLPRLEETTLGGQTGDMFHHWAPVPCLLTGKQKETRHVKDRNVQEKLIKHDKEAGGKKLIKQ